MVRRLGTGGHRCSRVDQRKSRFCSGRPLGGRFSQEGRLCRDRGGGDSDNALRSQTYCSCSAEGEVWLLPLGQPFGQCEVRLKVYTTCGKGDLAFVIVEADLQDQEWYEIEWHKDTRSNRVVEMEGKGSSRNAQVVAQWQA